jgi:hypothetical protein
MNNNQQIRMLLRERQALLVHFNTVMGRPDLGFPEDLQRAIGLRDAKLSFSTIQVGDTAPGAGRRGAEGSVGLVVDIAKNTIIVSTYHDDSGSGDRGSRGLSATVENVAASMERRRVSNELEIKNSVPVGILIMLPVRVHIVMEAYGTLTKAEIEIDLPRAMAAFGQQRLFGMDDRGFKEYDRPSSKWKSVSYDEIIDPNAFAAH